MALSRLDTTFGALADPTRRAILIRLMQGEATVKELSEPFAMSQPAISRHLKVLEKAGLIESSRRAQSRPRKLRAVPMRHAHEWLDDYRRFWEDRSTHLGVVLEKIRAERDERSELR